MSADGAWKITINTPMGAQEVNVIITTSGDTFTGKTTGGAATPRSAARSTATR